MIGEIRPSLLSTTETMTNDNSAASPTPTTTQDDSAVTVAESSHILAVAHHVQRGANSVDGVPRPTTSLVRAGAPPNSSGTPVRHHASHRHPRLHQGILHHAIARYATFTTAKTTSSPATSTSTARQLTMNTPSPPIHRRPCLNNRQFPSSCMVLLSI